MTRVRIRTGSKLPHDIRTIAHLAVFGMLGLFGLAAVIGGVLSFFVGMPEGMLLTLRPFSVLVTMAVVLFPLALWAFAAPEPPSRFLAPR